MKIKIKKIIKNMKVICDSSGKKERDYGQDVIKKKNNLLVS